MMNATHSALSAAQIFIVPTTSVSAKTKIAIGYAPTAKIAKINNYTIVFNLWYNLVYSSFLIAFTYTIVKQQLQRFFSLGETRA